MHITQFIYGEVDCRVYAIILLHYAVFLLKFSSNYSILFKRNMVCIYVYMTLCGVVLVYMYM